MPGDIWGGQDGAVGGEHSHAVTGVISAGSYVVAVMYFWLRLIASLYFADGWLEERSYLGVCVWGGRTVPHLFWGLAPKLCCCFCAVQDVARPKHRFSSQ